jgi:hypothetical protein
MRENVYPITPFITRVKKLSYFDCSRHYVGFLSLILKHDSRMHTRLNVTLHLPKCMSYLKQSLQHTLAYPFNIISNGCKSEKCNPIRISPAVQRRFVQLLFLSHPLCGVGSPRKDLFQRWLELEQLLSERQLLCHKAELTKNCKYYIRNRTSSSFHTKNNRFQPMTPTFAVSTKRQ